MMGNRIAFFRKEKGISQAQLAERVNISASAIGMYEQGRREPSSNILVALSRALGVSVDYLLTGTRCGNCDLQERVGVLIIVEDCITVNAQFKSLSKMRLRKILEELDREDC